MSNQLSEQFYPANFYEASFIDLATDTKEKMSFPIRLAGYKKMSSEYAIISHREIKMSNDLDGEDSLHEVIEEKIRYTYLDTIKFYIKKLFNFNLKRETCIKRVERKKDYNSSLLFDLQSLLFKYNRNKNILTQIIVSIERNLKGDITEMYLIGGRILNTEKGKRERISFLTDEKLQNIADYLSIERPTRYFNRKFRNKSELTNLCKKIMGRENYSIDGIVMNSPFYHYVWNNHFTV